MDEIECSRSIQIFFESFHYYLRNIFLLEAPEKTLVDNYMGEGERKRYRALKIYRFFRNQRVFVRRSDRAK